MGQGRRMGKKQGAPASFEEFHGRKGSTPQANARKRKLAQRTSAPLKKQRTAPGLAEARQSLFPTTATANGETKKDVKPPKELPAEDETNLDSLDEVDDVDLDGIEGSSGSDLEDLDDLEDDDELGDLGDDSDGSLVVDSDSELKGGIWSDEDEEDLDEANIEGLSRHLDAQAAQQDAEAQAELEEAAMQTNIAADLPAFSDDEDGAPQLKAQLAPDLQLLRTRMADTIRVLDDFAKYKEKDSSRSRADYTRQLLKDICAYYGYSPFLAEKLFNLFPPREAFAFFEANETPRPQVIRTNTLRTHRRELAQSLINRGVTLEPVGKWSKVGLQVFESNVPLGATPEYLAGHYIIQAASSFLPVMALAPEEDERVLDMAAAPGGKTTHLAALMKNTGCIFANDSNKNRAKALIGNIHRLGVANTIVCNYNALDFPKVMGGFDRVLLDAPCSGTGVIAKDASVKTNKTEADFMRLPHLQKQLLLAAIDSVNHASKTGGFLVYSTCSVTVEENEQVVQYALNKRPNVKLVETGLTLGKEGFTNYMGKKFHPSMRLTRRYYPHAYNVDGFFVSKLQKTGPSPATNGTATIDEASGERVPAQIVKAADGGEEEDPFAEFSNDEDATLIARSERRSMRKKGLNPRAVQGQAHVNGTSAAPSKEAGLVNGVATDKSKTKAK